MDTRERIIKAAQSLFFSKGIKAVRMDDIAASIRISKRTLYQHFPDKQTLLLSCLKAAQEESMREKHRILQTTENTLAIVLKFIRYESGRMKDLSSQFMHEVSQNPGVVEYFENMRKQETRHDMTFISKGVEQGYFRSDVNFELVQEFFQLSLENLTAKNMLLRYRPMQLFRNTFLVMLRGCLTEEGLRMLESMEQTDFGN